MKAKTFENLIRKVVREEIDYALRREIKTLKEDLREELKPTIVEHTEKKDEVPEEVKLSLKEKIMGTEPIKQHPKQNLPFTKDTTLNALLNETAQGSTNTETAMASNYSATDVIPTNAMPDPVQKVVNRDYRELMKAMDKKKGR